MKIQELIAWIEQRAPGTYFPNMFPTTGPDACSVVTLKPVVRKIVTRA
ncbi:hypothetical protein P7H17_16595 [Paenibacillus larvae]|nr:hypothetical protein [Paenibacillus larvae]MDT2287327.1 hypothetical protein [Paenibacillus larvae]